MLRTKLQKVSIALRLTGREINFCFVSDRVIRSYNKRYLRHDYVTDVISFPMGERGVLGDVMISTDTARRQAREQGHTIFHEVLILAIHGVLHLVGYRDETAAECQRMWKKTEELLQCAA